MSAIEQDVAKSLNIVGQNEDKVDHDYVVIIAGGHGTRLFPLSYDSHPKQFVSVNGEDTLIQNTVMRFEKIGIKASHIIIITTDDNQTKLAEEQVLDLGILSQNIYQIKPNYGYAGAMIKAAQFINKLDENAIIINSPSDQLIVMNDDFVETVKLAIKTASHGIPTIVGVKIHNIVTFMGCGHAVYDPEEQTPVRRVLRFVEKPDRKTADELMRQENAACNTGINVWRAQTLLDAMADVDIEDHEIGTDYFMDMLGELRVAVGHFKWYDCGTLDALYEVNREKMTENHHNISFGNVIRVGCRDSYFNAGRGHRIRAYNVDDALAVIATFVEGKPVFVACKRSESNRIRKIAEDYQKYNGFMDEDFGFCSRNNHIVWTDVSNECAISFVGVENYDVVVTKGTEPGIQYDWIISKPKPKNK